MANEPANNDKASNQQTKENPSAIRWSDAVVAEPKQHDDEMLMGPILRRKKVVSMPLGAEGEFFSGPDGPHRVRMNSNPRRQKQKSVGSQVFEQEKVTPRIRQNSSGLSSVMQGVLRRKQVSLDLLGPNDFFTAPIEEELLLSPLATTHEDEGIPEKEHELSEPTLFLPLRFAPRLIKAAVKSSGDGAIGAASCDTATVEALERYTNANRAMEQELEALKAHLEEDKKDGTISRHAEAMMKTRCESKADEDWLHRKLLSAAPQLESNKQQEEDFVVFDDDDIIRATKNDRIKAGVLFVIMLALTIFVSTWDTHLDVESFVFQPVGLACVTDCPGNLETRDFFRGHNHFERGDVIDLIMHLDSNALAEANRTEVLVEIVGEETNQVKAATTFGPPSEDQRASREHRITVDFDNPNEHHIINVYSTNAELEVSFTLNARVLHPLAKHSVAVAAVIMVSVYIFILIEVVHRTLVAIFGSMVALMFLFIMQNGETEGIRQIMLHLEWSTLGLLFGMMLIVGELSHTGVFEWCAVRLLMASKGSFKRLFVLLCVMTAFASAALDNVTCMLLVAPVTIDMCNILDVDPRPYLIGEVLLSNVGGTATLIGDPPNIIIGSSFDEIGFVDFITNVLPCIAAFCVPASLGLMVWVYRYYLTAKEMKALDTNKLIAAYPIYDEPRLYIAGTVTLFVILMFFLHPVHHKDTAWIALVGALITIAFTNPHDVQDALRNHVEWDTLLFFAGLFVLVEACAEMGLLEEIGSLLGTYIERQEEDQQLTVAITLLLWVSAIASAFLDNIPYTATLIPVIRFLSDSLPDTLPIEILAWALSLGACLGGNGTLLGASANIVTAGISTNKGFEISFVNFLYPGMLTMVVTVALSNLYMLVRYVWA